MSPSIAELEETWQINASGWSASKASSASVVLTLASSTASNASGALSNRLRLAWRPAAWTTASIGPLCGSTSASAAAIAGRSAQSACRWKIRHVPWRRLSSRARLAADSGERPLRIRLSASPVRCLARLESSAASSSPSPPSPPVISTVCICSSARGSAAASRPAGTSTGRNTRASRYSRLPLAAPLPSCSHKRRTQRRSSPTGSGRSIATSTGQCGITAPMERSMPIQDSRWQRSSASLARPASNTRSTGAAVAAIALSSATIGRLSAIQRRSSMPHR